MAKLQRFLSKVISSIVPIDSLHWLYHLLHQRSSSSNSPRKDNAISSPSTLIPVFCLLLLCQLVGFGLSNPAPAQPLEALLHPTLLQTLTISPLMVNAASRFILYQYGATESVWRNLALPISTRERSNLKTNPLFSLTATVPTKNIQISPRGPWKRAQTWSESKLFSAVFLKQHGELVRSGWEGSFQWEKAAGLTPARAEIFEASIHRIR